MTGPTDAVPTDRALRKDAARNRERLLAAARELFAEHGLQVTLNDIAHHAGVGVGTAYRRFANKEEVIDALFEESLLDVAAMAQASLDSPDAWQGLVSFLDGSLQRQFGNLGLNQIMNNADLGNERVAEARDRIAPLIQQLVDRAKDQGVVRSDLEQSDLIFIQAALSAIIDRSRTVEPDLYRRYLGLFLDGIRAGRKTFSPLPVAALDAQDTHLAMTVKRRKREVSDTV